MQSHPNNFGVALIWGMPMALALWALLIWFLWNLPAVLRWMLS